MDVILLEQKEEEEEEELKQPPKIETPKIASVLLYLPDSSDKLGIQIIQHSSGGWQVKGVDKNSLADKQGISRSDVILRINGEVPPANWGNLRKKLKQRPLSVEFSNTGIHDDDYLLINLDEECPDAYKCPICLEIMKEPVLLIGDGHTYEKEAIEQWIVKAKKGHHQVVSPMTGLTIPDTTLVPNFNIKKAIAEWFVKYPEQKRDEMEAEDLRTAIKLREKDVQKLSTDNDFPQKPNPQGDPRMLTGPTDVATGFMNGIGSIVSHAVSTTMEVPAGVTNIIGTGASMMSFDGEYIKDYEERVQEPPKHLIDGVANGVVVLGKSIFEGVTGVFIKPVKGAMDDGAAGFAKGLAEGLIGVIAKPIAGATGTVTEVLRGVGNTPNAIAKNDFAFRIRGIESIKQQFNNDDDDDDDDEYQPCKVEINDDGHQEEEEEEEESNVEEFESVQSQSDEENKK